MSRLIIVAAAAFLLVENHGTMVAQTHGTPDRFTVHAHRNAHQQ